MGGEPVIERNAGQRILDNIKSSAQQTPSHMAAMERIRNRSLFTETLFRCWIKKVLMGPKGNVEITLVVPYEQRAEAMELINSYGIPLDMQIFRMGGLDETGDSDSSSSNDKDATDDGGDNSSEWIDPLQDSYGSLVD